jgi:hypothetical protein
LENDSATAVAQIDNWGSPVTLVLTATEYERLDAGQCGHDGPIPVIKGEPTVLSIRKECRSIATLQWTVFPGSAQGAFRFGDAGGSADAASRVGDVIDNNTVLIATYRLK